MSERSALTDGRQPQVAELELDVDLAELRRIQSDSDLGPVLIEGPGDLERDLPGRRMRPGLDAGGAIGRPRDDLSDLATHAGCRMGAGNGVALQAGDLR